MVNLCSSAKTNKDYEEWCYDSNFNDKVSDESTLLSSKSEENIRCLAYLTEIFKIIPSKMDGNWFFIH